MAKHTRGGKKENLRLPIAIEQIKVGEGAIMTFGEGRTTKVDAVPTGCLSLDIALGVGGVPRGRVIEIYGPIIW
jgi:recombination protein RecA